MIATATDAEAVIHIPASSLNVFGSNNAAAASQHMVGANNAFFMLTGSFFNATPGHEANIRRAELMALIASRYAVAF